MRNGWILAQLVSCLFLPSLATADTGATPELEQTIAAVSELNRRLRDPVPRNCPETPPGRDGLYPDAWTATLKLTNDNKLFNLDYVLFGPSHSGDDLGYTHAYLLEIERDLPDRTRVTLVLSNDLYTQAIPGGTSIDDEGVRWVDQHFTEDQKLVLRMDSSKKRQLFYYRAGLGLQMLDSRPSGNPLSTAFQQSWTHRTLNEKLSASFRERVQIHDGRGLRAGVLAEGRAGLQKQVFSLAGGGIELVVFSEAGMDLSSLPEASQLAVTAGTRLNAAGPTVPALGRLVGSVQADATQRIHADGFVFEPHAEASFGTERGELGLEWRSYVGDLPNYVRYNTPGLNRDGRNDDVVSVFLRVRIGALGER